MSPQLTYTGYDGIAFLATLVRQRRPGSMLLITGQRSFVGQPYAQDVLAAFRSVPVTHEVFGASNPTLEQIAACQARVGPAGSRARLIVAIGGGSVLDMAKIVRAHLAGVTGRPAYLVAIPTTVGTGSEATQFATYYDGGTKRSLDQADVRPDCAILDPRFARGLPDDVALHTALDALSQAVESAWSRAATSESRGWAMLAVALHRVHYEPFMAHRGAADSLGLLGAANASGQAIQATRTTAAHALSYPLTARFGLPHGLAVALTLPALEEFNAGVGDADCRHPGGPTAVRKGLANLAAALGTPTVGAHYRSLFAAYGVTPLLSAYGARRSDVPALAGAALASGRADNNPRHLDQAAAEGILRSLF